jgi:hypothetical protein
MSDSIQIDRMTLAEKLRTMEMLWDELCRREADVPVPSWQKEILDERERLVEQGYAKVTRTYSLALQRLPFAPHSKGPSSQCRPRDGTRIFRQRC